MRSRTRNTDKRRAITGPGTRKRSSLFLAVDIGNTNITLGLFPIAGKRTNRGPLRIWRISTDASRTPDEYGAELVDLFGLAGFSAESVAAAGVASVVPALNAVFKEALGVYFGVRPSEIFMITFPLHFA